MELQTGQIINNTYRLIQRVGSGGFSVVWLASNVDDEHDLVAIKIYAPQQGLNPDDIVLFELEHKRLTELSHPNIIATKGYFKINESPCLVLDYCPKGSLHQRIKRDKRLTEADIAQLMRDIGGALSYLHALPTPIYHLDLKPDNILIDADENYILTDFGISNEVRNTMLRRSAVVAETFSYRSPERALNHNLSDKHDVFSFGVVLMECCRGFYDAKFSLADSVLNNYDLPSIEGYSTRLVEILNAIVQLEPEDRPTAFMLRQAGEHYLEKKYWDATSFNISKRTRRQVLNNDYYAPPIEDKKDDKYSLVVILFAILTVSVIGFAAYKFLSDNNKTVVTATNTISKCDEMANEIDNLFQRGLFSSIQNKYGNYSNSECKNPNVQDKINLSERCLLLLNSGNRFYNDDNFKDAQTDYQKFNSCGCPKDSLGKVSQRLELIPSRLAAEALKNQSINKINEAAKSHN